MSSGMRALAFFSAMLITFGVTSLDFENPDFEFNQNAYLLLACGVVLFILFVVKRLRA